MSRWALEKRARREGFSVIAGLDEAGRGPLAGPVVAAAVILPEKFPVRGVKDSKVLPLAVRERLYEDIYRHALAVGIGIVDPIEIDRVNILRASLTAMLWAVQDLSPQPDFLLVDGNQKIASQIPQQPVAKGDFKSVSIGAASIVAKVTRDRLMERYDYEFPGFGFARHKGYATKQHREAIRQLGPCPIHRKSFNGVGAGAQLSLFVDQVEV
ncbi:MAG: ribonuclease HII [Deltaproteobacteria bacterium]|nr:ribonuclease HII [Deltaproteobacteria bacterium]